MSVRVHLVSAAAAVLLTGCGGLFESKLAAPQTYVLRLPPGEAAPAAIPSGSILVQRPEAGPGLDSNRIALLRSDRRFDFYAASLWAAPTPDVVESVIVEALRATGTYAAVMDDSAPFSPRYNLRVILRRFEADYTAEGGNGGNPTVHVVMDCTVGRHRDRALLGSFTVRGSARARDDRLSDVVAAFEAATTAAMAELTRGVAGAVSNDRPASESR